MYFLIDYENVNYAGLEGTELLEQDDTIAFFYSSKNDKIVSYRMMDIAASGCSFEAYKLVNVQKNALDFYIASKVGEIFALDPEAQVAIISADKGYQAVMDYWRPRLQVANQLIRSKTIANAIKAVHGEEERKRIVNDRMKLLDLKVEYAKYEERNRIISILEERLGDTEYEAYIPQVVDMLIAKNKPKVLYLNSLKSFGKKDGTEVYRKIKECMAV